MTKSVPETAKLGDDVLGDAVREILLLGVARHIVERQHRDRRFVGQRQRCRLSDWRPGLAVGHAVHAQRPGDVLDGLLAAIVEGDVELALDLLVDVRRDADAAGIGQFLKARRDVDAVAVDVVALDDHVAQVDADAERDAPILGYLGVALGHAALDGDRAIDRVDDARELDQRAVAHQLDDAPAVVRDLGVDEFGAVGLQHVERAGLVVAHQARIADDIRAQDSGKPAFDALPRHPCPPVRYCRWPQCRQAAAPSLTARRRCRLSFRRHLERSLARS